MKKPISVVIERVQRMRSGHLPSYRRLMRSRAGWAEITAIALVLLALWRVTWRWDFSTVNSSGTITGGPHRSNIGVVGSLVEVIVAAGWMGFRGRPVYGALAVAIPPIVYVGWRGAVARVAGANLWPVEIVFLVAILGPGCALASAIGWRLARGRG